MRERQGNATQRADRVPQIARYSLGPYDDVYIPRQSHKTDWEVELAVVIGTEARYLDSPAQARDHIAGYAISNDVARLLRS
jgi:2-keto-4-pentenoate hydratase/2-oxohepta-3-ene-1,7-dioic acid hydratase in catechol pathway